MELSKKLVKDFAMVFEVVWVAMCCLGRQELMELFQKMGDPRLGKLLLIVDDILTASDLKEQAGKQSNLKKLKILGETLV